MKYGRPVPQADGTIRIVDVIDMSATAYQPPLLLGCTTDSELLARLFSPELCQQWMAGAQWFVVVPQGVQNGAEFIGSDYANPLAYTNPDGTDGNEVPRS